MATSVAVGGALTAHEHWILTAVNAGASSLSLAGSSFIVLCYLLFKELRKFSFKLVFYLALSVSESDSFDPYQVEAILDKENFTLEELLDEEDEEEIIQECKALNNRLINLYVSDQFKIMDFFCPNNFFPFMCLCSTALVDLEG